jgi:hypothetical protein
MTFVATFVCVGFKLLIHLCPQEITLSKFVYSKITKEKLLCVQERTS